MKSVIVKIRIASAKDVAKPTSKTHAGIGKIIMTMMAISATDRRTVGLNNFNFDIFIDVVSLRTQTVLARRIVLLGTTTACSTNLLVTV